MGLRGTGRAPNGSDCEQQVYREVYKERDRRIFLLPPSLSLSLGRRERGRDIIATVLTRIELPLGRTAISCNERVRGGGTRGRKQERRDVRRGIGRPDRAEAIAYESFRVRVQRNQ